MLFYPRLSQKTIIPTLRTLTNVSLLANSSYQTVNCVNNLSKPFSYINKNTFNFSTQKMNKQSSQKPQKHQFDANSSYFDILGVSPNATDEQIKSAYLQMVKRYHPDLSKQQNASQKFQLVQKAYEVLSDPQKRSQHRSTLNIPNPQVYEAADDFKQKFKDFKRKDRVPDEWQFSYKLFKKHYEEVDAKEKQYTKFPGQGDYQYWVHKDEMKPNPKIYIQQAAMVIGSVGIAGAALYYMWK